MATSEGAARGESVERHLSSGALDPSTRRMSLGLTEHTPVEAWHAMVAEPRLMSTAVHELTHFHSLRNPVGAVFTARAFFRSFFHDQMISRARSGDLTGIEHDAVLYVHEWMESQLMSELWRPLLEGLAVYTQSSLPCRDGSFHAPAQSLIDFAASLRGLDPARPDPTFQDVDVTVQDAIAATATTAVGDLPLGARLELHGTGEHLPYFLGHAYVRAVQARLRQADPDLDCPEHFTSFMLRLLGGSARRTLLGRGVRPGSGEAVERLYGWTELLDRSSLELRRSLVALPAGADVIDALLIGDADEPLVEQWETTSDVVHYLPDLLPTEYAYFSAKFAASGKPPFLSESTAAYAGQAGFAQAPGETFESMLAATGAADVGTAMLAGLPAYVSSTLWITMSSGGRCRVVGSLPEGTDDGRTYELAVSGHTWLVRLRPDDAERLGLDRRDVELEMETFLVDHWDAPLAVKLARTDGTSRAVLLRSEVDESLGRLVLVGLPRAEQEGRLAAMHLRESVETGADLAYTERSLRRLGLDWLADSLPTNAAKAAELRSQLRASWSRRILVGLLGAHGPDAVLDQIVDEGLSPSLLRLCPDQIAAAYTGPAQLSGPGRRDWLAMVAVANADAERTYGKPAFEILDDGVIRYLGLWEVP